MARFSRIPGPLLTFAALALLLPAAEAVARLAGLRPPAEGALAHAGLLSPEGTDPWWCRRHAARPQGARRVAVLSGSSAAGYFGIRHTEVFPALLEQRFAARGEVWVDNYALTGRNSFFHLECARRILADGDPPAVWVYFEGHKDFINARLANPFPRLALQRHPALLRAVEWGRRHLSLFALLAAPAGEQPPPERLAAHQGAVLDAFLGNLRELHAGIEASGGRLLLVTLPVNLELAPARSYPAAGPGGPALSASWHFERGERLKAAGRYPEALAELRLARDLDFSGYRAPGALNEALRAFAARHPRTVELYDLERELEGHFATEGIGCNFFGEAGVYCDYVHPNRRLQAWLAGRLADRLER